MGGPHTIPRSPVCLGRWASWVYTGLHAQRACAWLNALSSLPGSSSRFLNKENCIFHLALDPPYHAAGPVLRIGGQRCVDKRAHQESLEA